ncbi:MAG: hypothetical protein KA792_06765 [Bacteroidales bacterium]|nr:hypothetical protein [Bacteroidales bacterium]
MKKINLIIVAFIIPFILKAYTGQIIKSFNAPGKYITAICYDGNNIWAADRKEKKLFCLDKDNGKIIRSIPSPAFWTSGLTWDGKALWCSDVKGGLPLSENYNGIVYKVSPNDGTILQTLRVPVRKIRGIAWDSKYLWCTDNASDKIMQFNADDGTEIRSFSSPAGDAYGLAYDGKYLWNSDIALSEIYIINPEDGSVIVIAEAPGAFTNALCFDGQYIWANDLSSKKIYKLVAIDETKTRRYDEQKALLIYNHQVTNFGKGDLKSLDVYFAIPEERDNQLIHYSIGYSPNFTDIVTDKWGQKAAHFRINNLKPGNTNNIEIKIPVSTFNLRYYIYPDKVGKTEDIPLEIKKMFLADDEKYQKNNPVIQKGLKEAIGDEKNLYWSARKIYNYVMSHLYYEMSGGWNTAPTVLARGNGSCSEYSFVFISMCRAAGIPARYVGSIYREAPVFYDDAFHRWIEIYLPGYGWIPVDPTIGDKKSPREQALCFGFVSNEFFITTQGGGGSETLGWTYNSNEQYTSDPQTFITVDFWADWQEFEK